MLFQSSRIRSSLARTSKLGQEELVRRRSKASSAGSLGGLQFSGGPAGAQHDGGGAGGGGGGGGGGGRGDSGVHTLPLPAVPRPPSLTHSRPL